MTRPVHAPCPAGVSEVVPTVAPAPLRAEVTGALAVGFTSLLTSFPQLNALKGAQSGRMKNLTRHGRDVQDDVREELVRDQRALSAADLLGDGRADATW